MNISTVKFLALETAQRLHARGLHVFPVDHPQHPTCIGRHGPTSPCDGNRGKHPAVKWGVWAVTVTPQMIDLEWGKHGGLVNIGIACGPSNLVVLDEDAVGEIARWCDTYGIAGDLHETYTVATARGRHFYFRWDHSAQRIGNIPKATRGFKMDVRGDGGFVVAEGSQHVSGVIYTGNDLPIAPLPPVLAQKLLELGGTHPDPAEPGWEAVKAGVDLSATKIPYHERHDGLIAYAGRLRKSGLDLAEVEAAFYQRWLLCEQPTGQVPEAQYHSPSCPHPVTWEEAKAKLADVYDRYPAGRMDAEVVDAAGPPALADALLTRSQLRELPDPEPLIENVIDQGTVALLYGKWGSCKSFIALDLGGSVATGRPWQGRPTEQRRVLYVAAEGAYGLKGRLNAWESGWGIEIDDGGLDILPRPVNLLRPADMSNLGAMIGWNGYGLVILDTLARCMVGADENSAKDCGIAVDMLHQLRARTPDGRGVILGVHHTGKDGKTFRGSSAFEAGADTVYSVTLDGAVIILDREKRKDGPQLDVDRLKLEPVEGTESMIVEVSRGGTNDGRGDKLLSHIRSHFGDRGAYSSQLFESSEMPKSTFYRALSDLLERGELINGGTDKRPFYKLATK
jgi:hypothetical protein